MHKLYADWGRRVRMARTEFRWTQAEMAAIVGVTRSHLANIEAGRRPPTDEVKERIAGATRRTFDQLFPWPTEIPAFPSRTKATAAA